MVARARALGLALSFSPAVALAQNFTLIDLGTMGGRSSVAYDVNDLGQVVGSAETQDFFVRGFVWEDGVMTALPLGVGNSSDSRAINNLGEVAGMVKTSTGESRAAIWTADELITLGTLGGNISWGNDINDAGHLVGWSTVSGGRTRGIYWDGSKLWQLDPVVSGDCRAESINNDNHIAGYSNHSGMDALRWIDLTPEVLGSLGGSVARAYHVHDNGTIVGASTTKDSGMVVRAFRFDGSVMHELPSLGPGWSTAYDCNASGWAVGQSDGRACLWIGDEAVDLNDRIAPDSGIELIMARG